MKKISFKPRKSVTQVPLGWTPTKIRGKSEWRCKVIMFDFKN